VVIKMEGDRESRHAAWMGALQHFCSPQNSWAGRDDPDMVERLHAFLERSAPLVDDCQGAFSTQLNESINAIKNLSGVQSHCVEEFVGRTYLRHGAESERGA
jgi:hypothetical protein